VRGKEIKSETANLRETEKRRNTDSSTKSSTLTPMRKRDAKPTPNTQRTTRIEKKFAKEKSRKMRRKEEKNFWLNKKKLWPSREKRLQST
jgi:hypothetical protein